MDHKNSCIVLERVEVKFESLSKGVKTVAVIEKLDETKGSVEFVEKPNEPPIVLRISKKPNEPAIEKDIEILKDCPVSLLNFSKNILSVGTPIIIVKTIKQEVQGFIFAYL